MSHDDFTLRRDRRPRRSLHLRARVPPVIPAALRAPGVPVLGMPPGVADRLFPSGRAEAVDLVHDPLPPPLRPQAALGVLDMTEFFGETSGGIRTYLLEKAAYVEARPALRQVLILPGPRDAMTSTDGVRCYRAHGPPVPRQKPYRFLFAARATRRIVAHERPDVIEVGSPALVPWLAARAARQDAVPLVYFYHSNFPRVISPFPERGGAFRSRLSRLAWRYSRRIDKLFDVTIATSQFSADELRAAGIDRIAQVPLGVDLALFHPGRRDAREETRRRHGLSVEAPLVGFVGRFAREKELDLLLEAWDTVERRTDAWLVLIGDGPKRHMLEAGAAGRRIRLLPYQSTRTDLADLHAALDVYVAPSSVETFGLSSIESLASGTPVLAADRGGVSEQVTRSGAGRTFQAGVSESLAEELVTLLRDDLGALGTRGRAYVEREHDWRHVFDRLFAIYHDVRRA